MKIGIITWFDNLNYGTALQCYALQKYIKDNFECDVSVINYLPTNSDYIRRPSQKFEHLVYKIVSRIKETVYNDSNEYKNLINSTFSKEFAQKEKSFNEFLSNISFTKKIHSEYDFENLENNFDLFICGSDQIWNPTILNKRYYLDFVKKKPKIAYAVSFGIGYLPKYSHRYIAQYLKNFKAVGLRESTCRIQLQQVSQNQNISVVCDPTFLLDSDCWKSLQSKRLKKNKYFVSYFLGNTRISKKAMNFVSDKLGIENVILPFTKYMLNFSDKKSVSYGPSEFLDLISNAEFILTDSFHAVCFSLIFEKNFCVLPKHSNSNPFRQNSRIENLLKTVGLSNRLTYKVDEIGDIIFTPIDYSSVRVELQKHINFSKQFLNDNIDRG